MVTQKELDAAGITRLQVATATGIPYGSLGAKLNGYVPFKAEEESKIRVILEEAKATK